MDLQAALEKCRYKLSELKMLRMVYGMNKNPTELRISVLTQQAKLVARNEVLPRLTEEYNQLSFMYNLMREIMTEPSPKRPCNSDEVDILN